MYVLQKKETNTYIDMENSGWIEENIYEFENYILPGDYNIRVFYNPENYNEFIEEKFNK